MSQYQPPAPPPPSGSQPTLGELVARISENISLLIRGEIDLARAKGQRMARKIGVGVGLLAAAGVVALYAVGMLLASLAHGIGEALPLWAGYLIVAVLLLIVVAVLALVGVRRLQAARADTPAPQEGLKSSVETVRTAVASGLERGNSQ
ncbi:phage holin family protein [Actinomyces sp. 2119]|uniref:phage holin family protein n=1 Tax=Actinomyces sp. 2119 TaxID=2321393 RepID=UPI000E6B9C9D|nr:phage holin family protein [Actinomyces sp. 2119]RJF41921.1 phage holin family protein [Actinomyces sp. 2119]